MLMKQFYAQNIMMVIKPETKFWSLDEAGKTYLFTDSTDCKNL